MSINNSSNQFLPNNNCIKFLIYESQICQKDKIELPYELSITFGQQHENIINKINTNKIIFDNLLNSFIYDLPNNSFEYISKQFFEIIAFKTSIFFIRKNICSVKIPLIHLIKSNNKQWYFLKNDDDEICIKVLISLIHNIPKIKQKSEIQSHLRESFATNSLISIINDEYLNNDNNKILNQNNNMINISNKNINNINLSIGNKFYFPGASRSFVNTIEPYISKNDKFIPFKLNISPSQKRRYSFLEQIPSDFDYKNYSNLLNCAFKIKQEEINNKTNEIKEKKKLLEKEKNRLIMNKNEIKIETDKITNEMKLLEKNKQIYENKNIDLIDSLSAFEKNVFRANVQKEFDIYEKDIIKQLNNIRFINNNTDYNFDSSQKILNGIIINKNNKNINLNLNSTTKKINLKNSDEINLSSKFKKITVSNREKYNSYSHLKKNHNNNNINTKKRLESKQFSQINKTSVDNTINNFENNYTNYITITDSNSNRNNEKIFQDKKFIKTKYNRNISLLKIKLNIIKPNNNNKSMNNVNNKEKSNEKFNYKTEKSYKRLEKKKLNINIPFNNKISYPINNSLLNDINSEKERLKKCYSVKNIISLNKNCKNFENNIRFKNNSNDKIKYPNTMFKSFIRKNSQLLNKESCNSIIFIYSITEPANISTKNNLKKYIEKNSSSIRSINFSNQRKNSDTESKKSKICKKENLTSKTGNKKNIYFIPNKKNLIKEKSNIKYFGSVSQKNKFKKITLPFNTNRNNQKIMINNKYNLSLDENKYNQLKSRNIQHAK